MLQLEDLAELAAVHADSLKARIQSFEISGRLFDGNTRPAVMGVLNLSPDSWYRESVVLSTETAIQRGTVLAAQGADLVDLGAESSVLHAARADEALQASRLLPVLQGLRERQVRVSVETYVPEVARRCLEAGAVVLNLTGTDPDGEILRLVAAHDAAVILCYVEGDHVRAVGDFDLRSDPVPRMYEYFARQIERATRAGVRRLFVDPGLGFYYRNLQDSAVRVRHQMRVFLNTFRLRSLGWPTCSAPTKCPASARCSTPWRFGRTTFATVDLPPNAPKTGGQECVAI
jgi:dihydropteroate synthase